VQNQHLKIKPACDLIHTNHLLKKEFLKHFLINVIAYFAFVIFDFVIVINNHLFIKGNKSNDENI